MIENRTGTALSPDDVICAFHRFKFGIYWKKKAQCQHPNHLKRGFQHSKRSRPSLRSASLVLAQRIEKEFRVSFPVGESICDVHRKDIKDEGRRHDGNRDSESVVFPDETETVNDFVGKAIDKESASPMKFQVTSPIQKLAPSTIYYLGRKYKQYAQEFKRSLCEKIAPGQGAQLENMLSDSEEDGRGSGSNDEIDDFLKITLEAYSSWKTDKGRLAILSIIPKGQYSKEKVMEVFKCTKYQIEKSRQMADSYGPAGSAPDTTHSRQRIDQQKAEHFLDYLFESGALQDVAYGTTTLKYDSGDKESVAHAVLTARKSHVIQDYFAYCSDVAYDPLSRTTLWNILSAIKPSQRRALAFFLDLFIYPETSIRYRTSKFSLAFSHPYT